MIDPQGTDRQQIVSDVEHRKDSQSGSNAEDFVVCPACKGALEHDASTTKCVSCNAVYLKEDGYPILMVPGDERFDDTADCCLNADEERTNSFTTQHYNLPLLRKLLGEKLGDRRILSAGCGVGADVEILRNAGVEAYGVDCGSRTQAWLERDHKDAFHFGSVEHLPYLDNSFDAVITGCLLPHIGVVGDTSTVGPKWRAQRQCVADELMRVLKPGGNIVLGNPNRLCPADIFHKGQMNGPNSLVRWHKPSENFLLSFGDHAKLFTKGAKLETLPVAGYWGFHSKRERLPTRLLASVLSAYFRFLSIPQFSMLRRSAFNPWLMVLVTKEE